MKKKISIITPTFNSSKTIKGNLKSVLEQSYKHWEQIIVDNKSTDKTLSFIKSSSNKKIKIISEKDRGIYDAINKGIKASRGEIIAVLHSDDVYYDRNVLSDVIKKFTNTNTDIVYGDLIYVKKNNLKKIVRYWKTPNFYKRDFLKGWSPPHPSFFVKKKTHNLYGLYKTKIGNPADLDLMYRFMEKKKVKSEYIDKILVRMRYGGKSNESFKQIFRQNIQILDILEIKFNIIKILKFVSFKIINRFKQIIYK